tara:strand:+ start:583 stop:891 length:309 start_codon:yes stop_codon:yes gene_type:complete
MVFQVISKFKHLVHAAMKKAGNTPAARQKVIRDNPSWFTQKGKGAKGSKATSAPKAASAPKKSNAWSRLSPKIKDQLLKKKGKGMSEVQLAKYRDMYRNRNQ